MATIRQSFQNSTNKKDTECHWRSTTLAKKESGRGRGRCRGKGKGKGKGKFKCKVVVSSAPFVVLHSSLPPLSLLWRCCFAILHLLCGAAFLLPISCVTCSIQFPVSISVKHSWPLRGSASFCLFVDGVVPLCNLSCGWWCFSFSLSDAVLLFGSKK